MSHPPQQGSFESITGKPYVRRVHGLYHATPPEGVHILWNRDIAAPKNMIDNYEYSMLNDGAVPAAFDRSTKREALQHGIATKYAYKYRLDEGNFTRHIIH
jgi:hypothetical protein